MTRFEHLMEVAFTRNVQHAQFATVRKWLFHFHILNFLVDNLEEYSTIPFRDGTIECLDHFVDMIVPTCVTCKKPIKGDHMKLLDRSFHSECLVCEGSCRKNLKNQNVVLGRKFRTFCEVLAMASALEVMLESALINIFGRRILPEFISPLFALFVVFLSSIRKSREPATT